MSVAEQKPGSKAKELLKALEEAWAYFQPREIVLQPVYAVAEDRRRKPCAPRF